MSDDQKKDPCGRDGHRERLRGRYKAGGLSALADYEAVEFLLTLAIPRVDVKPVAKELVKKFRNLRGILDAPADELTKTKGLGDSAATSLKFMKDIISVYCREELEMPSEEIGTVSKLIKYFKSKIASNSCEVLELVCFDAKLKLIQGGCVRLFEGSVNSANVDIRKIVETAIRKGASSIAISHNHPSGDPRPSLEDIRLTRKLSDACRPISLNLIEHVIVGKNECFSFRRDGRFEDLCDDSIEEGRLRGRARVAEDAEGMLE